MAANRVLIVHDDAGFIDEVRQALAAMGADAEVLSALSGPRALGLVASHKPDVMVVDADLEGMDGYTLTEQLKSEPAIAGLPVVIVALAPSEASALRARQVGAAAHLPANGPVESIAGKVIDLLGQSAKSAIGMIADPPPSGGASRVGVVSPMGAADVESEPVAQSASPPAPEAPSRPLADANPVAVRPQPAVPGVPPAAPPAASAAPLPAPEPANVAAPRREESPPASRGYSGPGPVADPPASRVTVSGSAQDEAGDTPNIDDLLRLMIDRGGSDLHVSVGSPPGLRLRGELVQVENTKILGPRDTAEMILSLLSEDQRRKFETELELDFAYTIPGVSRFRANVFQQRNSLGAVFRVIPIRIPTMSELGLPKVCRYLAERPRGLVLITGPTGSGKSTTLAAMINHINEHRALHIITLEDPIEFMHKNKKAYVNQREVGEDTRSFASALKRVLRQDPDVILVGEMRDLETISAAITAAETGHLVLATLHTTGGPATVDRIIDVFPPHQQQQVRMQLSGTLEGVLSQVLLRTTDGKGRALAMEIMLGIPAISNLIREGKTHQMPTIIQGGASLGMQTLDQHLKNLLQAGRITFEEAVSKAQNPRELAQMVGRKI